MMGYVDNLPTLFFTDISYNGSPSFNSDGKILM